MDLLRFIATDGSSAMARWNRAQLQRPTQTACLHCGTTLVSPGLCDACLDAMDQVLCAAEARRQPPVTALEATIEDAERLAHIRQRQG